MGLREGIRRALTDRRYCRGAILRILNNINSKYHNNFTDHTGTDVMNEEWDNLIILDGCRADIFENMCWFDGNYNERVSRATESQKFLARNFEGKELHDTVYVSANPYAADLSNDTFHAFYDLYRTAWNEELQTIAPDSVVDTTKEIHTDFPNKKIIAHFMQPHYPFIGELGKQIDNSSIGRQQGDGTARMTIWSKLMYGEDCMSPVEVIRAYAENLEIVLTSIESLLEELNGRTVITADHGNLIGDIGDPIPVPAYGHPPEYFVEPLVDVPWFVIEGERRAITSEDPINQTGSEISDHVREERLSSLGYLE